MILSFESAWYMREDSTVDDVADSLEPRAADGPLVDVHAQRLAVQPVQHDVATKVERRIDRGGDKGERGGGNGGVDCTAVSGCGDEW